MDRMTRPEAREILIPPLYAIWLLVDWLRRTPNERAWKGTVINAGGGLVTIMVDRDVERYPRSGDRVRVTRAGERRD